ncbi:sigma-70 family RNA polymerase sigma factor [Pendulispora brunnea]|uniref:Sigma-70 family RNA polymerase sigma factor n=1 Tax=Pendulispora brunnea TaxID=2905690 RepID=A0ABZ2K6U5_9BACT
MADLRFPTTTMSIVFGLQSEDAAERARSMDRLATAYWKPVYKYVRMRWQKPPHEAEEMTQDFFLRVLAKHTFQGYETSRSRFRTFVRVCLDRFVVDAARHDQAKKRGEGVAPLALDFASAEAEVGDGGVADPERFFEAEWVRHLFEVSLGQLRTALVAAGREGHFVAFDRYHVAETGAEKPSYASLAEQLGISVPELTHRLQYARREFRAIVLLTLRELTSDPEEFRSEARLVLGVDV